MLSKPPVPLTLSTPYLAPVLRSRQRGGPPDRCAEPGAPMPRLAGRGKGPGPAGGSVRPKARTLVVFGFGALAGAW